MPTASSSNAIPRGDIYAAIMENDPAANVYIATELFRPFSVTEIAGAIGVIPAESMLSRQNTARSPQSGYNRSTWELEDIAFRCKENGHEELKDDSQAKQYRNYFDFETVLGKRGLHIVLREQEFRVRDLCHDTGTFTGATNTLDITNEWDDSANADPKGDIATGMKAIRDKCGLTANVLQIAWSSWWDLSHCDQILETLKYTEKPKGLLPTEALAAALGVERIVVPNLVYNSADKGQAKSISDIWTNEYAFLCVAAEDDDIQQPCVGRTLSFEEDGGLMTIEDYRSEEVRSDVIRARQCTQEKRFFTECGFLYTNVTT